MAKIFPENGEGLTFHQRSWSRCSGCIYKKRTRKANTRNAGLEQPFLGTPSASRPGSDHMARQTLVSLRTHTPLPPHPATSQARKDRAAAVPLEACATRGASGPAGSWVPCALPDDGWAGSRDLGLRAPPAEIRVLSRAWALVGGPRLDERSGAALSLSVAARTPTSARTWTSEGERTLNK